MKPPPLTKSQLDALKWLKDRGGDAAVAKSKDGGRFYLAQGETGPFTPATVKALVDAGEVMYYDAGGKRNSRIRVI